METFRKADVLFCMFFLHRMFIKENILLTDSEDKKIKYSELWLLICSKNTFYLFALKKVFYVLKKVFYIQKSLLCSQKSLSYSKNVFYVINEKFFFVLKTKVF